MTDISGAAAHELAAPTEGDLIKAQELVTRLQARIVKAQNEGRHNRVKVLQRMLKHSHSAKILSVERVTQSRNCRTPGTATQPED